VEWRQAFFEQHALIHGPDASAGGRFSYEDLVLGGLTEAQLRLRPADDLSSVAWLVWHITRCEDVAVNVAIAGRPQVLDDGWAAKLGVGRDDIGTGMTPREVADLSERVDIDVLLSYRHAVGRQTRDVIAAIDDGTIEAPVDADRDRQVAVLGDHVGWAVGRRPPWRGIDVLLLAAGHAYQHWGEAITIRSLSGLGLGL